MADGDRSNMSEVLNTWEKMPRDAKQFCQKIDYEDWETVDNPELIAMKKTLATKTGHQIINIMEELSNKDVTEKLTKKNITDNVDVEFERYGLQRMLSTFLVYKVDNLNEDQTREYIGDTDEKTDEEEIALLKNPHLTYKITQRKNDKKKAAAHTTTSNKPAAADIKTPPVDEAEDNVADDSSDGVDTDDVDSDDDKSSTKSVKDSDSESADTPKKAQKPTAKKPAAPRIRKAAAVAVATPKSAKSGAKTTKSESTKIAEIATDDAKSATDDEIPQKSAPTKPKPPSKSAAKLSAKLSGSVVKSKAKTPKPIARKKKTGEKSDEE